MKLLSVSLFLTVLRNYPWKPRPTEKPRPRTEKAPGFLPMPQPGDLMRIYSGLPAAALEESGTQALSFRSSLLKAVNG